MAERGEINPQPEEVDPSSREIIERPIGLRVRKWDQLERIAVEEATSLENAIGRATSVYDYVQSNLKNLYVKDRDGNLSPFKITMPPIPRPRWGEEEKK